MINLHKQKHNVKIVLSKFCNFFRTVNIVYFHFHESHNNLKFQRKMKNRIEFLKSKYQIVPLQELLDNPSSKKLSIMVDDAGSNFYSTGWEILRKEKIPFTLSIIAGLTESEPRTRLIANLMRIAGNPPSGLDYYTARSKLASFLIDSQSTLNDFDSIFVALNGLSNLELKKIYSVMNFPDHNFMDWKQIDEIKRKARIDIGSHSMSHPVLSLGSKEWLEWEVIESKKRIETNLGAECNFFTYPFGHSYCVSPKTEDAIRRAGYKNALLTTHCSFPFFENPYRIPRIDGEASSLKISYRRPC
jgi:peptidoglycan/xylan/chitin deacetylase (PgdA/CDA1 family)